jgi:hypothetical protein
MGVQTGKHFLQKLFANDQVVAVSDSEHTS